MAKQNLHFKAIIEVVQASTPSNGPLTQEVSVLFNGPAHSYVTPKFYTKTNPDTGKVVPTWNCSAAQVYGNARIFFDSQNDDTGAFLQKQITELTEHSEEHIMNYTGGENLDAWEVSDAPTNFVNILKRNIIGIEIDITRLEGKFKMSQEMGQADREGVIKGFEGVGYGNARKLAQTVNERRILKDQMKTAST